MPGTNSGLGGFMNGASIRFSKFKGGGLARDSAMLAAASNKYGAARPRTTGRELPKLLSIHSGTVVSMQPFGAFVQLGDGDKYKDGLLHVSCLCEDRVESPEQAGLEHGMKVWVKVSEIKEEEGKYGLDLRYVNQLDGTDLDPYQAKGKLPDNNFAPAGSKAAKRPISGVEPGGGGRLGGSGAEPASYGGGGPLPPVRAVALAEERGMAPAPAGAVDRGGGRPPPPEKEEDYEKVMRKLEKARSKLEHAKKKEEKVRRIELEKEKSKKKSKEERREEKGGKRDRRDEESRGRHKAKRRDEQEEEDEEEEEKLDGKFKEKRRMTMIGRGEADDDSEKRRFKRRRRRREDDDSDS